MLAAWAQQANGMGSCRGERGQEDGGSCCCPAPRIHLTSLLQPQEGKFLRRSVIQLQWDQSSLISRVCACSLDSLAQGQSQGFSTLRALKEASVCMYICVCLCLASLMSNTGWESLLFLLLVLSQLPGCLFLRNTEKPLWFGYPLSLL